MESCCSCLNGVNVGDVLREKSRLYNLYKDESNEDKRQVVANLILESVNVCSPCIKSTTNKLTLSYPTLIGGKKVNLCENCFRDIYQCSLNMGVSYRSYGRIKKIAKTSVYSGTNSRVNYATLKRTQTMKDKFVNIIEARAFFEREGFMDFDLFELQMSCINPTLDNIAVVEWMQEFVELTCDMTPNRFNNFELSTVYSKVSVFYLVHISRSLKKSLY